ncbi:MAG TPA: hypothetical protein VLG28_12880 [Acidimicrobiia bacterium]|jgi:predicted RNA-binding Zn-ribbon protein involved in translation (DUF1610 family)|nr:hypothetical protein [Acidimicrobiia bacterium]
MDLACPQCGEAEALQGERREGAIDMTCETCGFEWERSLAPKCPTCGGGDVETVPLAILEKSRGTQLSVVGTRPVTLCYGCDAAALTKFHKNRPNPLMPDELPHLGHVEN